MPGKAEFCGNTIASGNGSFSGARAAPEQAGAGRAGAVFVFETDGSTMAGEQFELGALSRDQRRGFAAVQDQFSVEPKVNGFLGGHMRR